MLGNPAIQNRVARAWDGAASYSKDITDFVSFGFSFEVIAAIAADAHFKFQSAPPSDADPCVPGVFTDVPAVATCMGETIVPGTLAEVIIPAGTPVNSICSATIPCRNDAFLRIVGTTGTIASVWAYWVLHGPSRG